MATGAAKIRRSCFSRSPRRNIGRHKLYDSVGLKLGGFRTIRSPEKYSCGSFLSPPNATSKKFIKSWARNMDDLSYDICVCPCWAFPASSFPFETHVCIRYSAQYLCVIFTSYCADYTHRLIFILTRETLHYSISI